LRENKNGFPYGTANDNKMNKYILPIMMLLLMCGNGLQAQVKKKVKAPVKKQISHPKKKTAVIRVTTADKKQPTVNKPTVQSEVTEQKKTLVVNSPSGEDSKIQDNTLPQKFRLMEFQPGDEKSYRFSAGIRLLWGVGLSSKYFFRDRHAAEVILKIRGYRGIGRDVCLAGLYEYHKSIPGIDGLKVYGGGGAYVGYFSFKENISLALERAGYDNELYAGISGVIGAEYKFDGIPIAISVDWQPSLTLIDSYSGSGFGAQGGGLGVKYTF
jgi:hypothetical protein